MEKEFANFGEFLTAKRTERGVGLRELAKQLGISSPYLTEVEKNRCAPLTTERLAKAAEVLELTPEERNQMYDIVGLQRDIVAPDISEYIKGKSYIDVALRTARDSGAGEAEWLKMIENMKKQKG